MQQQSCVALPCLLLLSQAGCVLGRCSCTGIGYGLEGIARGFPQDYGTACLAWDDGDCDRHSCGSSQTCDQLWVDVQKGTWCCQPWCYVDPNTCNTPDVQPSTQMGMSKTLYYSYNACTSHAVTYNETTCPWQAPMSFEEAYGAILVAERISELLAHSDKGHADLAVTELPVGGEVAITAGKDAKICVFKLRFYGGHRTFCTPEAADPVASVVATSQWVATVTEGSRSITFWEFFDGSSPSLNMLGQRTGAGPQPLRYLKYLDGIGLLSSCEDGYVSVWPVTDVNAMTNGSEAATGALGPFAWAPRALEKVTYGHEVGVACGSYADIEIWVQLAGNWTQWVRMSGHSRLITSLSFLPSLGLLASASLDSNIGLWHFKSGQWKLATYLYDHSKPVKALVWIPSVPMLASGDEESVILWKPVDQPMCEFSYTRGYYLPGFNRREFASKTMAFCRQLCCENPWCSSFDYAHRGDGATHGDRTCWLSSAAEGRYGGAGLEWDTTANYDYYEITKRGSRFMTLEQPKGISGFAFVQVNGLLLSGNDEDGVVDVWKLSSSNCPDGQMAKGDGHSCILCPAGRAGIGGNCRTCRPGTIADEDGLLKCKLCPQGHYNAGIGGVQCIPCSPGSYADTVGTDQCILCPLGYAGSRTAATRASDCAPCSTRQYAAQIGSTSCTSCPAGKAHDLYAMSSPAACTRCEYCGHARGGGINGSCPVPKATASCEDCPGGMVISTTGSCEYCPLGDFPNSTSGATACGRFAAGDFDAVSKRNRRQCYSRDQYAQFRCPVTMNAGWGAQGKPIDHDRRKHLDLSTAENEACSRLVCMGAFYELNVIAERQSGECLLDTTLRSLCDWSLARLNEGISEREAAARSAEETAEYQLRYRKLIELVGACWQLCHEVTLSEQAAESAFDVLPFHPSQCSVSGLSVHYECTSERPAKSVKRIKTGLSYEEVRSIAVQRTTLPRCEANCAHCPEPSGRHYVSSFQACEGRASPRLGWTCLALLLWLALVSYCMHLDF